MPLDSLILQMVAMGVPDVRKFPFIDAPAVASIEYAVQSLKEHGALSNTEKLTPIGTDKLFDFKTDMDFNFSYVLEFWWLH